MPRKPAFPREVRERAVKMVFEHRDEYESQWSAITSIAQKFGMTSETLRSWVRQAEADDGRRPGTTTADTERIKELERENHELRRANERSSRRRRLSSRGSSTRNHRGVERLHRWHRSSLGVEPIWRYLGIAPSTYYAVKQRAAAPSARARRDAELLVEIRRVHDRSRGLYGARKVWLQLRREGIMAARCTVERLMSQHGLEGVSRGGGGARRSPTARPSGRLISSIAPSVSRRPTRLWVADFTYVMTWSGVVYVALVIDAFSRRIVGCKADTTMKTSLVLDTLETALWSRQRAGLPVAAGLVHHHDAGSQYTSFAFTSRLLEAGVDASVGSVGDGYDNALAETTIGLYKTEKIHREGPWRTLSDVELATLEWVDWYNHERLHSACRDAPQSSSRISIS